MSGSLFGEIVNSCDSATGFSAGGISGDDDFAEGTGALGAKVSNTVTEFYTTSLGATAPYSFASGGGEDGQHFLMWFSSKSKLDATSGYRLIMGNGTSRGQWDVPPVTSELKRNGAFVTRVIDPSRDFDRIAAGSWTTAGNPAQLSNVTQMGGALQTTVSIMGSFNNAQIDQMIIGWGIRLSGGTIGTPDTFEVARAADEDAGIWGWSQARILKGGIYIGPATGSAASVFNSNGETRIFAAAPVAAGFYRIEARGAGTDVTITSTTITAEDSADARWDYTVGADTNSWADTDSIYSGIRNMTLESFATLTNTKLTDVSLITQNAATLTGLAVSDANTADGVALVLSDDPSKISNCSFAFSDGHAIEIDTPGTYTFTGNSFTGYGADATNDAAIYNNSGGAVTLNIVGGDTPTVRNGAGASTTVNNSKTITFNVNFKGAAPANFEWRLYEASPTPGVVGTVELDGTETETVTSIAYSYTYTADQAVILQVIATGYEEALFDATLFNSNQTFTVPVEVETNL